MRIDRWISGLYSLYLIHISTIFFFFIRTIIFFHAFFPVAIDVLVRVLFNLALLCWALSRFAESLVFIMFFQFYIHFLFHANFEFCVYAWMLNTQKTSEKKFFPPLWIESKLGISVLHLVNRKILFKWMSKFSTGLSLISSLFPNTNCELHSHANLIGNSFRKCEWCSGYFWNWKHQCYPCTHTHIQTSKAWPLSFEPTCFWTAN